MTCAHLKRLYQLCQQESLRFSSAELVRIVCQECGMEEVCPSTLTDEYDAKSSLRVEEPQAPGTDHRRDDNK